MSDSELQSMPMGSITIETMTQRTSDRIVEQRGHHTHHHNHHHHHRRSGGGHHSSHKDSGVKGKVTKSQLASILAAITAVVIFTIFAYWMASESPVNLRTSSMQRNIELSNAQSHTNCTDFVGAVRAVQNLAGHAGYLHQFEYERLHPCCAVRDYNGVAQRPVVDTSDIVFVVLTSSATIAHARAVLASWGQGLEHLLFISDEANAEIGSILLEEEMRGGSSGARAGSGGGGAAGDTDTNSGSRGANSQKYRQMWALKYIYADKADNGLRSKPWFFLCDDETWLNIPAILELASRYHHACPVTVGYVWSSQDHAQAIDYVSARAGVLMSQAAFLGLTPAFLTEACPMSNKWSDIQFGRCAWSQKVQIVHHRGFYYDEPERTGGPDPELIWLPPIAESLTYHHVPPNDMSTMTSYANGRWQYTAKPARNNTATYFESNAKFATLALSLQQQ